MIVHEYVGHPPLTSPLTYYNLIGLPVHPLVLKKEKCILEIQKGQRKKVFL